MNEIIMVLFLIAIISTMAIVLGITISKFHNGKNINTDLDIPYYDELTNEEEIIILLRNIARNQKAIKTNTTIIAVIMLIPIVTSILIIVIKINVIIEIIETLFN